MKQIPLKYSIDTGAVDAEGKKVFKEESVNINVPETFTEAGQVYGEDVFYAKGMAQIIIDARRLCYKAKDSAEAQETVNKWTPGISLARATGMTKKEIGEMLGDMSEDEILEMVEEIKKKRG